MTDNRFEELRFSTDHCWVRRSSDGQITVGLTEFAQQALGAIVFAGLPSVGSVYAENQALGEVESTKAVSELYAPVAGTITAINDDLAETPGVINTDPYGAGSICVFAPSDSAAFDRLLDLGGYEELTDTSPEAKPSTKD